MFLTDLGLELIKLNLENGKTKVGLHYLYCHLKIFKFKFYISYRDQLGILFCTKFVLYQCESGVFLCDSEEEWEPSR